MDSGEVLVSSAEVLQELLHAYLPVGREATLDAALALAQGRLAQIWPIEVEDVLLARALAAALGVGATRQGTPEWYKSTILE